MTLTVYAGATTPNVTFVRPELAKLMPLYALIRDVIAGEPTVKAMRQTYLPMPNKADKSPENVARYEAYLERAVFYNVARRTIYGFLGQIFSAAPEYKVPPNMQSVVDNATGGGVSLEQLAKKSVLYNLAYARGGLFVDYPDTGGEGGSQEDIASGKMRPTITAYPPTSIINWRVTESGADEILSLVVIFETFPLFDDGFEIKSCGQFRVLRLDEAGLYELSIWREPSPREYKGNKVPKGNYKRVEVYHPTDAKGQRFDRIPFSFFGADNNDAHPDNPSFYDLCSLNIAHYRNSADYEESCFLVGQPTLVATGLTKDWVDEVLNGQMQIGSRAIIPLPQGGDAKLIQAESNTMLAEAMETKELQMVALGAMLAEKKTVQRTATESKIDAATDTSILTNSTNNVASAIELSLKFCAKFMGVDESAISYKLSTEFAIAKMSSEELRALVELWVKNAISFKEMRGGLRLGGVSIQEDTVAMKEIAAEKEANIEMAQRQAQATKPPVAEPSVGNKQK